MGKNQQRHPRRLQWLPKTAVGERRGREASAAMLCWRKTELVEERGCAAEGKGGAAMGVEEEQGTVAQRPIVL